MELKWLEDFISVAEKGHFAHAAEARFVTQSALSRRIQSLESWIGTALFNRSTHPIKLTPAGEDFIGTARAIVDQCYEARSAANEYSKIGKNSITISSLHTLALKFVPDLISDWYSVTSPFSTLIIAETRAAEDYLTSLQNGASDFFISYHHKSISFDFNPVQFPSIEIERHHLRPYQSIDSDPVDLLEDGSGAIPYVSYSNTSFMSRIFEQLLGKARFKKRLNIVYRAALVESILAATQKGFGISWLPETVVPGDPAEQGLRLVPSNHATELSIRIYCSASNGNPIVSDIWDHLKRQKP